jgi:hypothetical protein
MATNPVCAPSILDAYSSKLMLQAPTVKEELAKLASSHEMYLHQPSTQDSMPFAHDEDSNINFNHDSNINFDDVPVDPNFMLYQDDSSIESSVHSSTTSSSISDAVDMGI